MPETALPLLLDRFRVARAVRDDVPAVVALLRDDPLGATRESDELAPYLRAFAAVDADPAHLLVVVRDERREDAVVGTLQLTDLPGLSRGAALRVQVEAVRVAASARGTGLGTALLGWVVEHARERGASLVQLTTDRSRADAQRFYERLGFEASHVGMKLAVE